MKRALIDTLRDFTGRTARRWSDRPTGLYCFNFHRVGNDDGSAFHPNLYSCTGQRFQEIIRFLKKEFSLIGITDVVNLVNGSRRPTERLALISFDDGYIDNFTTAYPVLKSEGCPAVFFVQTDFIDGVEIPWWDRIAWCIWHSGDIELRLPGESKPLAVQGPKSELSIRRVLRAVKDARGSPMEDKVRAIELQTGCSAPSAAGRLAMTWDHVRELHQEGMGIGSHTRSHRILAHLSLHEQFLELESSKRILEARSGAEVLALAYPVGGFASYSDDTRVLAKQCGYRIAFNYEHDVNVDPAGITYDLRRLPVEGNPTIEALRRMIAYAPIA